VLYSSFLKQARYLPTIFAVEKALTGSDLGFGAVVALTTVATLMPRLIAGVGPADRSFGPFTPGLEKILGRVAMMGEWRRSVVIRFSTNNISAGLERNNTIFSALLSTSDFLQY
jgi:hypothetical protein